MNNSITVYQIKRFIRAHFPLFISIVVLILLLFITLSQYQRYESRRGEVELFESEVKSLNERVKTVEINKVVTQDQIQQFNKLLGSLIPDQEDFFSIIYALEEISIKTNFVISSYSIDLGRSNSEKITLSVEGRGNAESFLRFLQEYQFSGGRLITSDRIEYSGATISNVRITLNLYSKELVLVDSTQIPQITKKDIEKIAAIQKKVTITYTSEDYKIPDTAYETKENPFQ